MMSFQKLKDAYPDITINGGIFAALQELDVPWADESISTLLDIDYIANRSGNKIISGLVDMFLADGVISTSANEILATTIFALYGEKWAKLWATLSLEYNPIENYSMVETMRGDEKITAYGHQTQRTNDLTHGKTGTVTTEPGSETTETNSVYGFNSSEAVDSDIKTTGVTGSDETTYNTEDTDTGTQTDTESGRDVETRNYQLSRAGNIGVTTSQQMIESERNLWQWDFFRSVVYPDIDRILTIEIY